MSICSLCKFNTIDGFKRGGYSREYDFTVALAGNPNTGKSTVFNNLTGMKQHTGNWPGKTVSSARGAFGFLDKNFELIDLPGTYSLLSTSEDEEIARDFILFEKPNVTIAVVDASRLERNLNLVLQILEITGSVVVCLNLMDEAKRHHIEIDVRTLARDLGVPVVATSARSNDGMSSLLQAVYDVAQKNIQTRPHRAVSIPKTAKDAIDKINDGLLKIYPKMSNSRWIAMRLLEGDASVIKAVQEGKINERRK